MKCSMASTQYTFTNTIESIRLITIELEYQCVLKSEYCHNSKCLCMFGLFYSQANCGKSYKICHANFKRMPIKWMERFTTWNYWIKLREYLKIVLIVAHCIEFCIVLLGLIKCLRLSLEISKILLICPCFIYQALKLSIRTICVINYEQILKIASFKMRFPIKAEDIFDTFQYHQFNSGQIKSLTSE